MLKPADMPLASVFPNTQYFEFHSVAVGVPLAVWVTTPSGYDSAATQRYPAIFTPDGNLFAPISIPFAALLSGGATGGDLGHPIRPYIQVTIGYCGTEDISARLRDLLPPGEPAPKYVADVINGLVANGHWTAEFGAQAIAKLSQGRADAFLRFITEELYPAVAARWRVDPADTGFFGDSYGGLFAVWMALQRPKQFPIFGAGSPGLASPDSTVFALLKREIDIGADYSGRHLHLSIAEREISVPSYFQSAAEQYTRLLRMLGQTPLKGLKLTTHTVPFETHVTGVPGNFFSFLRACYSVAGK